MDLTTAYSFDDLTNEAERLVIEELGRQLEDAGDAACVEEDCILDIAAYALNHVRPMYRVNLMGRLYADTLMQQHGDEIRAAVREAIRKISADYR
ncbi:MAG TPA: late competence development ComFB family protein [Alkalispirochaeta sp.]|nr:late competence development ComFB family protein [Alkalispirochaeta sp.]